MWKYEIFTFFKMLRNFDVGAPIRHSTPIIGSNLGKNGTKLVWLWFQAYYDIKFWILEFSQFWTKIVISTHTRHITLLTGQICYQICLVVVLAILWQEIFESFSFLNFAQKLVISAQIRHITLITGQICYQICLWEIVILRCTL